MANWVLDFNGHPVNLDHVYKLTANDAGGGVFKIYALLDEEVAGQVEDFVELKGTWGSLNDARAAAKRLTGAVDPSEYGDLD